MLGLIQMNNCNNRLINKNLDYHKIDENGLKNEPLEQFSNTVQEGWNLESLKVCYTSN